ncbi:MAG: ribosomal-processing cysteine protease Prp [Clostridiales bacterium]|jgi:uncharacterized protein YsxB (DUF464 family)|nr:ribosomal-processing cysteine protease Prp [Clostridiales bacterium]
MTTVKIGRQNKNIVSLHSFGHTEFDVQGQDIVCAALSSIIQTAALGLMQVVGIDIGLVRDDNKGKLSFSLPSLSESDRLKANCILDTMLLGIADLHDTYSDFIELIVN